MLAQERQDRITQLVEEHGSVSGSALVGELGASPATIRRDIEALARAGRVIKVHGGATAIHSVVYETSDRAMDEKYSLYIDEKDAIATYAATLIEPGDFVYVDAGSTTETLVDHLGPSAAGATFVTNSIVTARKLVRKGYRTLMTGGELKASTEALVGPEAITGIERYHFTKGFWGTNGATLEQGFTTPDINEAQVKRTSMERTGKRYVLADTSKFGTVAPVTFAEFASATVITNGGVDEMYQQQVNVVEVPA